MTPVRIAEVILREVGAQTDEAIDLAEAALALASLDQPERDLAPYRAHLAALVRDVGAAAQKPGVAPYAALRDVLVGAYGYTGDRDSYDALDNADLMRVIDRRRGLPVALSILWLHAARAQGWGAAGINFPSHFLIRIDSGDPTILDPFNDGRALSPPTLRALLKQVAGERMELTPAHCAEIGNRVILLRLQNNIKLRLLRAERMPEALSIAERMVLIAPQEGGLWQDCAVLHRAVGNLKSALGCFERAMALAADESARQAIAQEMSALRGKLN
jgi:regulator of sirC expression with transglutaminase-like and TPR domain